jgi:glycosyltransferase involved in cell wall biosynthesis
MEGKVTIIIPAYNEEEVIGDVIKGLMALPGDFKILVVNDGSTDNTAQTAAQAGAKVINHPYNKGNGAAVKTGIRNATGDVIVMMDGDGQHNPEDVPRLLELIPDYDMVVGARIGRSNGRFHRNIANKIYNWFASYITNMKIRDLTSGFRAAKMEVIHKFLYMLPNTFSYPATSTLALIKAGYSVGYVPIEVSRRIGKSKIRLFKDGIRFFLIITKIATLFSPFKVFLPISMVSILLGLGYGAYRVLFLNMRYSYTTVFLVSTGVMIFLMGLISEQIATLRMDRTDGE